MSSYLSNAGVYRFSHRKAEFRLKSLEPEFRTQRVWRRELYLPLIDGLKRACNTKGRSGLRISFSARQVLNIPLRRRSCVRFR